MLLLLLLLVAGVRLAEASSDPLYLYALSESTPARHLTFIGELPRPVTTTACINDPFFQSLGCGAAFALMGYQSESTDYTRPANWQTGDRFSATAAIRGPTGTSIAQNWGKLWDGSPLLHTLHEASVTAAPGFWTGMAANGSVDRVSGCRSWSADDTSASGSTGSPEFISSRWITNGAAFCSSTLSFLCVCVPPSQVPPTPNPTGLYMYSSNGLYVPSQIGLRPQTTPACRSQGMFDYLRCGDAFALLGYQADGLSTYTRAINPETGVPFSGTTPVLGPTGVEIAPNWAGLWRADSVPIETTTFLAGVYTGYHDISYSGINRTGGLAQNNCDDWEIGYAPWFGVAGADGYTDGGWVDYTTVSCSGNHAYACVCLPQAPTSSPVSPPTLSPSMADVPEVPVDPQATQAVGSVGFVGALLVVFLVLAL